MSERTDALATIRQVLDGRAGLYRALNGARTVEDYLARGAAGEDEETLTEPLLADLLERVLDFPPDGYFAQLSRSGLKPDFTPVDLVAHRFVLDAKSSAQRNLDLHERQIRTYIDQRRLDFGVLFNLRELRVYRRGEHGAVRDLSFQLLPIWKVARGEALPTTEVDRFLEFRQRFRFQELDMESRVRLIRRAAPWKQLEAGGEELAIDVEYLVDRLRSLSRVLAEDAAAQQEALDRHLRFNVGAEPVLVAELRMLALDLAPGTDPATLPDSVDGYRGREGLPSRVWSQYLLRVSQLALTRVVLYRSWEDAGFVDERLYDGGFGDLYDRLGKSLRRVLAEAFAAGRDRYPWLFGSENNYDWYRPRDEPLIEVLYALTPVPLGKLDADVLGGLYESYVDEIDRDRLGQFYTPRAVVRFMLDRAGFSGPQGTFRIEGDARHPRAVLDFATGSGGFLVESARRIADEAIGGDARTIDEGLEAIVRGLHGCEISPFPYYLTEVNLLLQVSRLLGRLRQLGVDAPRFVLSVVHADTLSARAGRDESLAGLASDVRADQAELVRDERFGLVPLDPEKGEAFQRIRASGGFDLVVGNPPYVFESNNKVVFDRLRALPGWKGEYHGKGDYLYYFLVFAAERVAPGGRLAVITPAGWMNAGAAGWLRERLAADLRLDELFLFGSYRLFAPEQGDRRDRVRAQTPTVESAILIATKAPAPRGHALRVVALEDERAAARALSGSDRVLAPDRDDLLAAMGERAGARGGRRNGIFAHSLRQDALRHDEPWPVKFGARDLPTRVVAHLDAQLAAGAGVEPLAALWDVVRGIESGADAYTERIRKRLSQADRDRLAANGCKVGDPILELPPGRELEPPWSDHPELLARSPESRALLYAAIDEEDYAHLVWIGRDETVPASIVDALEAWKPVLATRAEIVRNPSRHWFETLWPRDKDQLRSPKVIALYRTDRGRFSLDEDGAWQPSNKATFCTAKEPGLSVAYLCGLLNSELLDLWFAVRGKSPRDVWRNYEPKAMRRIPYRHVHGAADAPSPVLARAREAHDVAKLLAGGARAAEALAVDMDAAGAAARALEEVVRTLAENRRRLLAQRAAAPELRRMVKDPWRTGPVALDEHALIAELSPGELRSVRVDPDLAVEVSGDGPLGRPTLHGDRLVFESRRRVTAIVSGLPDRLAVLARLIDHRQRLMPGDLHSTLLPADLAGFDLRAARRLTEIDRLLADGRDLVELAERLVCRLYGAPRELEDEVVARAVARAAASAPSED